MPTTPTFVRERVWYDKGATCILGVDEAGAGALAGPVVAAAAHVPLTSGLGAIRDSKQISSVVREQLFAQFAGRGIRFAVGLASVGEIETLGIRRANFLALRRAIENFPEVADVVFIDWYTLPGLGIPQEAIVRGDQHVKSIAAASIVAKVTRDRMMKELAFEYRGYGFAQHKGYGTFQHLKALQERGPSPIHRTHFIRKALARQQKVL